MDKTKYNRASKDPTQLQQFVNEACDAINEGGGDLSVASLTVSFADDPGVTEVYPTYLETSYDTDEQKVSCGLWSDDIYEPFAVHATHKTDGIEGHLTFGYSDDYESFVFQAIDEVGSGIRVYGGYLQILFEGNAALELEAEERCINANNANFVLPTTGGTFLVATNINDIIELTPTGAQFNAAAYNGKLVMLKDIGEREPPFEITFSMATALVDLKINQVDLGELYEPRSGSTPCTLSFTRLEPMRGYNVYIDMRDPVIAHVYCDREIDER